MSPYLQFGNSVLHSASKMGHVEVVLLLLKYADDSWVGLYSVLLTRYTVHRRRKLRGGRGPTFSPSTQIDM